MLDFLRDVILEVRGINSEKWHKEKLEKDISKKENIYLLSKKTKIIIFVFGIIYLLAEVINIVVFWENNGMINIRAKGIILSIIDIIVLVCLLLKNKTTEIIAIIFSIIFIILMYTSSMLLRWF